MSWLIPRTRGSFFSDQERQWLELLFDAIFPGDVSQGIPTTNQANPVAFLDRLFTHPDIFREIPTWQNQYRELMPLLDVQSQNLFDSALANLNRGQVTELLTRMEKGELNDIDASQQKVFFRLLRSHCIQGCFSDPSWGGNNNHVMWRWYGYKQAPEDLL